ncbi:hypothetical protein SAY87_031059 [Trapa incisa]|uniref:Cold regulated protein 27 n=1 Tax=Trapa incisa TaxID=236973 RepID=A0AAN7KWT2_9MYRT|nr:hypothetical protein SAY87_031059 [Trapa incisa]
MENSQASLPSESSNVSWELKPDSTPGSSKAESITTEWTDEKHSHYLRSVEASFVNELYDSFDFPKFHLQKEHSTPTCCPSGQYKVLQHGFWHKVNFARPSFSQNKADGSRRVLASPWIRRFRSSSKQQNHEVVSVNENGAISCVLAANVQRPSSRRPHRKINSNPATLGDNSAICDFREFSDQNFVDGDEGGEGESKSRKSGSKRVKTVEDRTSSVDQVVSSSSGKPLNDE